jgi:hypothetical protein
MAIQISSCLIFLALTLIFSQDVTLKVPFSSPSDEIPTQLGEYSFSDFTSWSDLNAEIKRAEMFYPATGLNLKPEQGLILTSEFKIHDLVGICDNESRFFEVNLVKLAGIELTGWHSKKIYAIRKLPREGNSKTRPISH